MTNRQLEIIKQLGFTSVVTDEVISELDSKTTLAAKKVLERIDFIVNERKSKFIIYMSKDKFTIDSPVIVTQQEAKQISQVLNLEYIKLGTAVDQAGLWIEWVNEINNSR